MVCGDMRGYASRHFGVLLMCRQHGAQIARTIQAEERAGNQLVNLLGSTYGSALAAASGGKLQHHQKLIKESWGTRPTKID